MLCVICILREKDGLSHGCCPRVLVRLFEDYLGPVFVILCLKTPRHNLYSKMEENNQFRNHINMVTATHNYSQNDGFSNERLVVYSSSAAGLDQNAAFQAEIDALDRQRQALIFKQQEAAKKAETDHMHTYTHGGASASSSNTAANPAFSSARAPGEAPPPYSPIPHQPPSPRQHITSLTRSETAPIRTSHLPKPIAIPATSTKLGSPFLRAYPPQLEEESYGINRAQFLGFLDDLNRCAVASPPVQILGLAGNIVGFVPLQTAQIVGASVNLAASVATYGVSKGRTEMCLRGANRELFAPRGLKVEIAKLDALAKIAGIPGVLDPVTGKLDKKASVLAPLEELEEEEEEEEGSLGEGEGGTMVAPSQRAQRRRLQALESWIAPLDLAPLPEIKQSGNVLGKLHAMASERQRHKEEKKMLKGRDKHFKECEKGDREAAKVEREFEKDMAKLDKEERKVRAKEAGSRKKLEEELGKIDKERAKLAKEREEEMEMIEKNKRKEDKEEGSLRKILWLIVRNIEDSSGPGPNPDLESPGSSPR